MVQAFGKDALQTFPRGDALHVLLGRGLGSDTELWRDNISQLAKEHLNTFNVPPEELEEVAGEREVCGFLLKLLPVNKYR